MKNFPVAGVAIQVWLLLGLPFLAVPVSCERLPSDEERDVPELSLSELADIFASLPLEQEHLEEVHAAVSASTSNGYDEEYTMSDLFRAPGSGVGDKKAGTKAPSNWSHPLHSLLEEHIKGLFSTKASSTSAEEYITALMASDAQIYWPYSEKWDGHTTPVITFDPGVEVESNTGWLRHEDGSLEELVVTEEMAAERPVWVINRNDDGDYMSLEMLRRLDPDWGKGGSIIVSPQTKADASKKDVRSLLLKEFVMMRPYDCWLAGASEFWVKCGSVEDFTASTEAELKLYTPTVTDFMISVRRYQIGQKIPFNALLISELTDQLESFALMIVEDDGGSQTTWNCSATVKVQSKSYGFDISLPMRTRDDIVWRGQVSRKYFEAYNNVQGHFGDVYLTFQIL